MASVERVSPIELGFIEEISDNSKLQSKFFPSKVGGKPSWLNPIDIPSEIVCKICGEPCLFLIQVYAPGGEHEPHAFHRTIFIFTCPNGDCCLANQSENMHVFRCQLPRSNNFYPFDPVPDTDITIATSPVSLCQLCGCRGDKKCSKCNLATYCSKTHQTLHWKKGHKTNCDSNTSRNVLFPEFEVVTETEELDKSAITDNSVPASNIADCGQLPVEELEAMANQNEDKTFSKFRKRIEQNPDQILRYNRGGSPLWVSQESPQSQVPVCPNCGSERIFEFQVMPQLLNHLKLDRVQENSLDWGTLVVYTCKQNCDQGTSAYHEEIVFKQDFM